MNIQVQVKLEVNNEVVAVRTIRPTIGLLNETCEYWWKLYALRYKNFRIYYDMPSRMNKNRKVDNCPHLVDVEQED